MFLYCSGKRGGEEEVEKEGKQGKEGAGGEGEGKEKEQEEKKEKEQEEKEKKGPKVFYFLETFQPLYFHDVSNNVKRPIKV